MKYKLFIGISIILSLGFTSCIDFLNLEPQDGVIAEKYWQNKEEVRDAVNGCYAGMMTYTNMEKYIWWGELRADLVKPRVTNGLFTSMDNFQNGDITSSMKYTSWADAYKIINNCNTVLNYAKETKKIDASFTFDLLHQYEAEAICIRSLMYFYLVRTFQDVPYITDASLSDSQDYRVAKTSGEVIIDSLISSLKSVDRTQNGTMFGIPFNHGTDAKTNKGRFTVWSLKALLADIYLWKEDYANCANECTQIINSGQFTLVPINSTPVDVEDIFKNIYTIYLPNEGDADNLFTNLYVKGNSVESILELQFGTDYENPFYNYFNPINGALTANTEVLSPAGLFIPSSLDRGWYDIRGEGVSYKQGYVWKWIGLSRNTYSYRSLGQSFSNWIFYRLADVMLMKAEALCEMGKISGDITQLQASLDIVKQIRLRACAPESTNMIPDETMLNADVLEKYILTERAREFSHEGKRWFDVLRNAKRNNYAGISYLVELAAYAATPEKASSLESKWKGSKFSHYLPIYENELKVNKALVQNPFYAK